MSQMVLPQNLPNKASSEDASRSGSSRSAQEKSGESPFDAVSRAEEKRLKAEKADKARQSSDAEEARRAEKADQADKAKQADRAEKAERADSKAEGARVKQSGAEKPDDASKTDAKAAAAETSDEKAGQKSATDDLELVPEPDSDMSGLAALSAVPPAMPPPAPSSAPVTFAGLQSLASSAQPQGSSASASGQGQPFVQGALMSLSGMNGNGRNGSMTLQVSGQIPGQSSSLPGGALSEALLAGVTGDGAKPSESPMLQNAIRFQGALEAVSAQANTVNTPKMAPEAPILRGYTTSIDVPVSHAEWGDKMAGKLSWLTASNMSVAEIHLTPPDMGPMEVKVQVQQEQASITVHSANPVVREQLELHSHRLRDMLSEQGLSLEQFDVSDSGGEQAGNGETGDEQPAGDGLMADAEQEDLAEPRSLDLAWKGEVDIFA